MDYTSRNGNGVLTSSLTPRFSHSDTTAIQERVDLAQFCQLLVSTRNLKRCHIHGAQTLCLCDNETNVHYLIEKAELSRRSEGSAIETTAEVEFATE